MKLTSQIVKWQNKFGRDYTDRNTMGVEAYEEHKKKIFGLTKSELLEKYLGALNISNVLEVGSNIGLQLLIMEKNGYKNLYGIEVQEYAVDKSKQLTAGKDIYIVKGSALDIPYKNDYFDLVFTCAVLMHISPEEINFALDEIYRCSKRYIFGEEYYSQGYNNINYRGDTQLLWKNDYAELFLKRFKNLRLLKKMIFNEEGDESKKSCVYLLEKY